MKNIKVELNLVYCTFPVEKCIKSLQRNPDKFFKPGRFDRIKFYIKENKSRRYITYNEYLRKYQDCKINIIKSN